MREFSQSEPGARRLRKDTFAFAAVARITQYTSSATGFITYTNFYSDGHESSCTGMPQMATGTYIWNGDCVPDAH